MTHPKDTPATSGSADQAVKYFTNRIKHGNPIPETEYSHFLALFRAAEKAAELQDKLEDVKSVIYHEEKRSESLRQRVKDLEGALTTERDKIFYLMVRGLSSEYDVGLAKERMTEALNLSRTGGK